MVDERTRSREPEPEPTSYYEEWFDYITSIQERVHNDFVVSEDSIPWEQSRQGRLKFYTLPIFDDAVLPQNLVFRHEIREVSGRHTHQGGLVLFGTKGEGATLVGDEKLDWEEGDLILLPVQPGGISHQHFNRNDPDDPAEWLAFIFMPHMTQLGAEFTQNEVSQDWAKDHDHHHGDEAGQADHEAYHDYEGEFEGFEYEDWLTYEPPEETDSLFEDLIVARNEFRREMAQSQDAGNWGKIAKDQVEWEWNEQGKTKWYLHPSFDDRPIKNMLCAIQQIPPGSRSGKQHRQGGVTHYVLEGEGYTLINGQKHEWSAGDYLGLPVTPDGLTVQHFNAQPDEPAEFIWSEPYIPMLGYDMGCGFEQLESCPEYE